MFGDGSAEFRADKSGYVAGGAISWKWDAAKQKFVTSMGDVILDWNNLSDEAKTNLTGPQGPQGVAGPAGSDGLIYYTWIRYADTSVGGGISNDPTGKLYIGFAYNKTTATESNTPSDYTWSLIKGEKGDTGVQGPTGANGQTFYTWIKYSDYADGTNLYDTPTSNTQYIGIAVNKTTPTESSVKTDYTWSKFKGDTGENGAQGPPGADGVDANLLPWVQDYDNNKTLIDGEYVISPKMFSGTKDVATNKLTGVALGRGVVSVNGVKKTGVFGVKNGEITFSLDSETGDVKLAGHVDAKSGSIGSLEIVDGDIVGRDELGVIRLLVSKSELSAFTDLNEENKQTLVARQESQPQEFNVNVTYSVPEDEYDTNSGYDYSHASNMFFTTDSPVFSTTAGCNLTLDISTSLHAGEYTLSPNANLHHTIFRFEIINSVTQEVVYAWSYTGGIENATIPSAGSYFCRLVHSISINYINQNQSSIEASGYVYGDFTIDAIYGVKRTLIGSDGLYSYWGPHDYIYAKRNTSGQLDIKMRGNIEIMKRDGTVLISG